MIASGEYFSMILILDTYLLDSNEVLEGVRYLKRKCEENEMEETIVSDIRVKKSVPMTLTVLASHFLALFRKFIDGFGLLMSQF